MSAAATSARGAGSRVDAHLHVWDLAVSEYAWLTPDLGALHTSFTPEQAHTELEAAGIGSAVLVQAEDSERDTEHMLAVADRHPWVAGVVGWVQLDDPGRAAEQLDRWQRHPAFCGVRHLVHADNRDDFLALPSVRRSLADVAARGLPLDVPDAWPTHLDGARDLAAALPQLRVVVDHLAKPPTGAGFEAWARALRDIAARPNTVAKVSGLQTVPGWNAETVRPAWEVALDCFGPSRLMYGGDWPMTVPTGGYQHAWAVTAQLLDDLAPDERASVLAGTAADVYGLPQTVGNR